MVSRITKKSPGFKSRLGPFCVVICVSEDVHGSGYLVIPNCRCEC